MTESTGNKAEKFYENEKKLSRMNSRELNRILIVNQKEPSVIANVETDSDSAEDIDNNRRQMAKLAAQSKKEREKRMRQKQQMQMAYDMPQNQSGLLGKMHYFTQLVDHGIKYQMYKDDEYSPTGNSWNQSDVDEAYHQFDPNLYPMKTAKIQKKINKESDSENQETKQDEQEGDSNDVYPTNKPNLETFGGYVELRSQQQSQMHSQKMSSAKTPRKNASALKQKGSLKDTNQKKEPQKVMWESKANNSLDSSQEDEKQTVTVQQKIQIPATLNLSSQPVSELNTTEQSAIQTDRTSPQTHQQSTTRRKSKKEKIPTHVSLAGADITPVLVNEFQPETPMLGPNYRQKSKRSQKHKKNKYESPQQREIRIEQIVKRLSQSSKQARDKKQVLESNKLTTLKLQRIDSRFKQNQEDSEQESREGTPDKILREFREKALRYKIGKQSEADSPAADFKEIQAFYKDEWDLTTKSLYNPSTAVKFEAYIENLGKTVTAQLSKKLGHRVRIGIKDGSKAKKIQIFITTHHQQKWHLTQKGYGHGYGTKDKLSPEDALLQQILDNAQTPKALQGLQGKQKREAIQMIRKSFVPQLTKKDPKPIKDAQKALTLTCRRKLPIDKEGNVIQVFSKYQNKDFLESRPVSMNRQQTIQLKMAQLQSQNFDQHLSVQQLQTVDTVTENSLINNVPAYLEETYGRLLLPSELRNKEMNIATGGCVSSRVSEMSGTMSHLPANIEFRSHSKKASDSNLQKLNGMSTNFEISSPKNKGKTTNALPNTEEGKQRHERWIKKVETLIEQFDLDKNEKSASEQIQIDEVSRELNKAKQLLIDQFNDAVEKNQAPLVQEVSTSNEDLNQNESRYSGGDSVDTPTRKRRLEHFMEAQRKEAMARTLQTEEQRADYAQMLKKMHDKYAELEVRASMTMSHRWNAAKELVKYQMKNQDRKVRMERLRNKRKRGVFTRPSNHQFASGKSITKSQISTISSQRDNKSCHRSQGQGDFYTPQDLFRKLQDEKVQREAFQAKNLSKKSFKSSSNQFRQHHIASHSSNPKMRQNSSMNFRAIQVGESNMISSRNSLDERNSSLNRLADSKSNVGSNDYRSHKRQLYLTTQDIPRMLNQQSTISFNKKSSNHLIGQKFDSKDQIPLAQTSRDNAHTETKPNQVDEGKVFDRKKFFQELAQMGVRVPQRHMETFEREKQRNQSNSPRTNTTLSPFINKRNSQESLNEEKRNVNVLPKQLTNTRQLSTPKNPIIKPLDKFPSLAANTNFSRFNKVTLQEDNNQQKTPNSVEMDLKFEKLNQTARTNLFIRDEMLQQPIPEQMFSESSHDGGREIETPTLPSQIGASQIGDQNQRQGVSRDFGRRFQEHLNRMSKKELPEINSPDTILISRQSFNKKEDEEEGTQMNKKDDAMGQTVQRPSFFEMMQHKKVSVKFEKRKEPQQNYRAQQMTLYSANGDLDSLFDKDYEEGKHGKQTRMRTLGESHFQSVKKSVREKRKIQQNQPIRQGQAHSSSKMADYIPHSIGKPQTISLKQTLQKSFMNHKSPEEKRILKRLQQNELHESTIKYPKQNLTPKMLSQIPSKLLSKTQLNIDSKASFGLNQASTHQFVGQKSIKNVKKLDFQRENHSVSPLQMMLQEMKHEKKGESAGQDQVDLSHIMGKSTISGFDQPQKKNDLQAQMLLTQSKYTPLQMNSTVLNGTTSDFGGPNPKLKDQIVTQRFRSQIKQRSGAENGNFVQQMASHQRFNIPHTAEILANFSSRPKQNKRSQNQSVPPRISFENRHKVMLQTGLEKQSLVQSSFNRLGESKTLDQQSLKSQLRAQKLAQMNQTGTSHVDFGISRNRAKHSTYSVFNESLPPMNSQEPHPDQTTAQSSRLNQTVFAAHLRNQSLPFAEKPFNFDQNSQTMGSMQQLLASLTPKQGFGVQGSKKSNQPKFDLLSTKHVSYQHVPGLEKDPTEIGLGVPGGLMDESSKIRYTFKQFQQDASKEHTKNILPSMKKLL